MRIELLTVFPNKMQVYIATRGPIPDVEEFISELRGKYLPFKAKFKEDKDKKNYMLQVLVRPIQLWEVAFPKEHKDVMLNTLFVNCPENRPQYKRWINIIRKLLKIKPIPEYDKSFKIPITTKNMDVVGIGIKEDEEVKTNEVEYEGI